MLVKIKEERFEAELCDTLWKKFRGLMFRKNPKPLFFVFKKPTRQPIHSFFCKPFRAIWLDKGEVIDDKIIKPFRLSIKPERDFTQILEVPSK